MSETGNPNGRFCRAVPPYEEYLRLVEQAEMLEDIQDYDRAKAALDAGQEEIIPADVEFALVDGENPVKVWREFRRLTRRQLADAAGISAPFLSQIESGKRKSSTKVLAKLAHGVVSKCLPGQEDVFD